MISLLAMRRKGKLDHASFKTPFYPYFPLIALLLSVICLIAIIWYNFILSIIFFAGLALLLIIFIGLKKLYVMYSLGKMTLHPAAVGEWSQVSFLIKGYIRESLMEPFLVTFFALKNSYPGGSQKIFENKK
jgi:hypothetical protein